MEYFRMNKHPWRTVNTVTFVQWEVVSDSVHVANGLQSIASAFSTPTVCGMFAGKGAFKNALKQVRFLKEHRRHYVPVFNLTIRLGRGYNVLIY